MKNDNISNNKPTGNGVEAVDPRWTPGNEADPLSKEDLAEVMSRLPRNSVLKGMSAEMKVLKKENVEAEKSNGAFKESAEALKAEVAVAATNKLQLFESSESSASACVISNNDRSDTSILFGVDTWVKGTSNEYTSSKVETRFYSNGKDIGCTYKNGVGQTLRWLADDNWRLVAHSTADRVELTTYGSDAMLIEHAHLKKENWLGRHGSQYKYTQLKTWGGDDNGMGWCLSRDPNDNRSWGNHVPAKACFYRLRFHDDGKVYGWKAGSTSEEWLSLN